MRSSLVFHDWSQERTTQRTPWLDIQSTVACCSIWLKTTTLKSKKFEYSVKASNKLMGGGGGGVLGRVSLH